MVWSLQDTAANAVSDGEATAEAEQSVLAAAVADAPLGEMQLAAAFHYRHSTLQC
jgi:hypothetical protein